MRGLCFIFTIARAGVVDLLKTLMRARHTHIHDLQPPQPYSQWAYANSGTWLDDITHDSSDGCQLRSSPSSLPYVKISKEEGEDIALVELKFFRGTSEDRLVKVRLT